MTYDVKSSPSLWSSSIGGAPLGKFALLGVYGCNGRGSVHKLSTFERNIQQALAAAENSKADGRRRRLACPHGDDGCLNQTRVTQHNGTEWRLERSAGVAQNKEN